MKDKEHGPISRKLRILLGVLLLLAGAFIFCRFNSNFLIRSSGMIFVVLSALLLSSSRAGLSTVEQRGDKDTDLRNRLKKVNPTLWSIGGGTFLALMGSFALLYEDAVTGYNQVLPVYVFFIMVLVCTGVWAYIVSKLF